MTAVAGMVPRRRGCTMAETSRKITAVKPMAASAATIRNLLILLSVVARPAGMTPTLHRMDIARKPRMNHGNTDFILTLTPWSPLCAAAFFLRCTLMAAKISTVGMMASVRVSLTMVA